MTKTLHERLIDELMEGKVNLSEREHAAKNEIAKLRKEIKELAKKPSKKKAK